MPAVSGRYALGYSHRLHQRSEFLNFFRGSEVFRLEKCAIFRVPNQLGHYRLGVTFKVKVNSVERNALRRRVREAIRTMSPELGSYDYNVVVRRVERPVRIYARALAKDVQAGLRTRTPAATKSGHRS